MGALNLFILALIAFGLQLRFCSGVSLFIGVKTSAKNHQSRLQLLLKTWVTEASAETYFFTDGADGELQSQVGEEHLIVTGCGGTHLRADLCCKTWSILQRYLHGGGAEATATDVADWLCLADDDTYVNVPILREVLSNLTGSSNDGAHNTPAGQARTTASDAAGAAARKEFYVGKPSLARRLKVPPLFSRAYSDIDVDTEYIFATGGAGVCMSRAAVQRLNAHMVGRGKTLVQVCGDLGCPDDMSLGIVFEAVLHIKLHVSGHLHSHLESLRAVREPLEQATLSYVTGPRYVNTVDAGRLSKVLPVAEDPTRLLSVHCSRFPTIAWCAP